MQTSARAAQAAYQRSEVSAAGPLRIVVLLYEGAVRFLRLGNEKFDEPAARGHALGRAHRIVTELLAALDHDKGGEIAARLDSLYRYALGAITRANVGGDRAALDSTIQVLQTLLSGWREIEARSGADGAAGTP
jgi:flagellar protein FliS